MNALYFELGMMLIMELAKRREIDGDAREVIVKAAATGDSEEAFKIIAKSPKAKQTVITIVADLIEKVFGKDK